MVEFLPQPSGAVLARAKGGDVRVGGRKLSTGSSRKLRQGVSVYVGGVRLGIGADEDNARRDASARGRSFTVIRWSAAAMTALVIFGFVGYGGSLAKTLFPDFADKRFSPQPVAFTAPFDEAMPALENEIRMAGLSADLEVVQPENGRLEVSGSLTASQQARWMQVRTWFDGQYGSRTMLTSAVSSKDNRIVLPFDIASVSAGRASRVMLKSGRDYGVGETLPGGWLLESVEDMTVTLSRETQALQISF